MEDDLVTGVFLGLQGFLFLVNIIGNSLVCIVVFRFKCLQNFTSFLLVNLAVGDLVLGTTGTAHLLVSALSKQEAFKVCSLMSTLVYVSATGSLYTITVIAVDRYVAIVKPFYNRSTVTTGKLKVIIPLIWIMAVGLTLPSFLFLSGNDYRNEKRIACWDALTQDNFPSLYKLFLSALMYVFPMGVIGVSYGKTFRYLWSGKNKRIQTTSRVILASRRKLTKVLGIVIIVFNICWLPWFVVDLLLTLNWIPQYNYLRSEIIALFALANSSLNPLVYSLQSKNFRNHILNLIKHK